MVADCENQTDRLLKQMQRGRSMKRELSSYPRKLPWPCRVIEQQYRYSMHIGEGTAEAQRAQQGMIWASRRRA